MSSRIVTGVSPEGRRASIDSQKVFRGPGVLPRLAYRVGEAASVLGVSEDHFARHIAPELRWVRRGAVKLVSRSELERWLQSSAAPVLDDPQLA